VQGSIQELAQDIIAYSKMNPPRYTDQHGGSDGDMAQIKAMANGQRVESPSCPQAGMVQISARVLGVMKLLMDNGFLIGTFALATDHQHLGCGSDHAWGNAVDISAIGRPETGLLNVNSGGPAVKRLVMQAMTLIRAQKRGVLKPNQLICNGTGGRYDPQVQSLQLNNYEDDNYITDDHVDHFHVGYGH
jgi:hypothetical protein